MSASSSIPSAVSVQGQTETKPAAAIPLVGYSHFSIQPIFFLLEYHRILEGQRMLEIQRRLDNQNQEKILEDLIRSNIRNEALPVEEKTSAVGRVSVPVSTTNPISIKRRIDVAASTSGIDEKRQQKRRRAETPLPVRDSKDSYLHTPLTPHTRTPTLSADSLSSTIFLDGLNKRIEKYLKTKINNRIRLINATHSDRWDDSYKLYKEFRKMLEKEGISDTKTCEEMIKNMISWIQKTCESKEKKEKDFYKKLKAQADQMDKDLVNYHGEYTRDSMGIVIPSSLVLLEGVKERIEKYLNKKIENLAFVKGDRWKNTYQIYVELRKKLELEEVTDTKTCEEMVKCMISFIKKTCNKFVLSKRTKHKDIYKKLIAQVDLLDKDLATYHKKYAREDFEDSTPSAPSSLVQSTPLSTRPTVENPRLLEPGDAAVDFADEKYVSRSLLSPMENVLDFGLAATSETENELIANGLPLPPELADFKEDDWTFASLNGAEKTFDFNPVATSEVEDELIANDCPLPPELAAGDDWAPASLSCSEESLNFIRATPGDPELNLEDDVVSSPTSSSPHTAVGFGGGMPAPLPSSSRDPLPGMSERLSYSPTFFAFNHSSFSPLPPLPSLDP